MIMNRPKPTAPSVHHLRFSAVNRRFLISDPRSGAWGPTESAASRRRRHGPFGGSCWRGATHPIARRRGCGTPTPTPTPAPAGGRLRRAALLDERLRVARRLEAVERLIPDDARPAVLDAALGREVGGRVDRAEALCVAGVVQRRLEERLDEALARQLRLVEQREHAALALDGADRLRVLRPLDLALVVGRGRERVE